MALEEFSMRLRDGQVVGYRQSMLAALVPLSAISLLFLLVLSPWAWLLHHQVVVVPTLSSWGFVVVTARVVTQVIVRVRQLN
jgi:hypothetical protein